MRLVLLGLGLLLIAVPAKAAEPTISTPPADATDRQVCTLLADPGKATPDDPFADRARFDELLIETAYADVSGDGQLERLWSDDEGTMHNHLPRATAANGMDIPITDVLHQPPPDDAGASDASESDTSENVNGVRWLIYGSRVYILEFADDGPDGYLRLVERLTKAHVAAPVCKFTTKAQVTLFALTDYRADSLAWKRDIETCTAIEAKKVRELPTHPLHPVIDAEVPGGGSEISAYVEGRLDNASITRRAYLRTTDSGAGPGCGRQDYVPRPKHISTAFDHNLDQLEGGSCANSEARWIEFKGRIYLERQAGGASAPAALQDEFHRVDLFEDGKVRMICKAMFSPKARNLIGVWDGHHWARP